MPEVNTQEAGKTGKKQTRSAQTKNRERYMLVTESEKLCEQIGKTPAEQRAEVFDTLSAVPIDHPAVAIIRGSEAKGDETTRWTKIEPLNAENMGTLLDDIGETEKDGVSRAAFIGVDKSNRPCFRVTESTRDEDSQSITTTEYQYLKEGVDPVEYANKMNKLQNQLSELSWNSDEAKAARAEISSLNKESLDYGVFAMQSMNALGVTREQFTEMKVERAGDEKQAKEQESEKAPKRNSPMSQAYHNIKDATYNKDIEAGKTPEEAEKHSRAVAWSKVGAQYNKGAKKETAKVSEETEKGKESSVLGELDAMKGKADALAAEAAKNSEKTQPVKNTKEAITV